jgi:polyhydroxybutyrate depolymerase
VKALALLLAAALLLRSAPVAAAEPPPFPDMSTSWYLYREAVAALRDRGVLSGYPDGSFKPRETVNRAEFLKLVFNAKDPGDVVGATEECFSDVPKDAWFAPFVCAAKRRGIAKGYPDGSFKPEQEVNWAEAIALVSRAYGWDTEERDGERWYEPFVDTFDRRDVLAAHSYVPWHPLSRERAADLVYRMLQFERGVTFEKSPGCTAGDTKVPTSVTVGGIERSLIISAPQGAKRDEPTPLLIAFHGRTNTNAQVQSYMRFEREAPDMIVAYPAGMPAAGGGFTWTGEGGADVALFDAMVEAIGAHLCVDMDRIYVAGHSLGGWMANSIACLRGGVVRASGSVGGDGIVTGCTGPSAAFIAHNPKDVTPPIAGSERVRERRVADDACAWETEDAIPFALLCQRHQGCQSGNDVLWCPHEIDNDERGHFYPHTWPRGTAKYMLDFFEGLDG